MFDTNELNDTYELAHIHEADEYHNRPHEVRCDICDAEGYGSEQYLRSIGWELYRGGEFCPGH